jgi:two-component sensor histidine kinase
MPNSEIHSESIYHGPGGKLISAVERLTGASDVHEIVQVIRETARSLVGSDGIAVILREGETCHYVEEDAVGPLWKGQRFPLTSCISGWAMINRKTVVVPDITQDARIPQSLYRDTFVRSLVMAPVRSADPIGAIGAYWSSTYHPASHDIETVEVLARATATAMENVRLVAALSAALREAEHARDELQHRVKNAFAAAQSLASLTLPPEHARALKARLAALGRAHDLLDRKLATQASIQLAELVHAELQPYDSEALGRLVVRGPSVVVPSTQAVALGLVLNELATNAIKHGALSVPEGKLEVSWSVASPNLAIQWKESDGPAVRAAAAENYGSRLLSRLVEGQLGGTIRREMAPDGVTCAMQFPLIAMGVTPIREPSGAEEHARAG